MSTSGKLRSPKPSACPACGFANPPGFNFCGRCGAPLAEARRTSIPPVERRQVTVLFCDLVGSVPLSRRLELEDLRDVIRSYQARCAAIVREFGGTISRYMGDGILVLFGYPHAQEDAAERAVRAGLSMVEAVARMPPPTAGERLAARVGIATGLVVAGDLIGDGSAEEQAILGETPNLAGRLHASAPPDGVVIASSTHSLLGERFICEDLGPQIVKGFPTPVPMWRVLAPRPVGSRFQAAGRLTPLVDREDDLAWLLRLWQSAASRRGRVAMLVGEAGIGKSRVAEALCELLGDGCSVLRFQCSPHYVNRALHPLIQQLEIAAGIAPEEPPRAKLEKLSAWLGPEAENGKALPLLATLLSIPAAYAPPLPPMSAQRQKQDTFDLLVRLMRRQSAGRPLLIIFEDLHWADPTTQEFLSSQVQRIDRFATLAILTFRPHFAAPWTGANVEQRELPRLPRTPAIRLIEQVAGAGRMSGAVLEQVVERTDGVPLFIEELTRAILGLGLLSEAGDPTAGPAALPPLAIPSTLQDSLMARLDRLGPAKVVAQLASVIGREFGFPLLSAMAPLPPDRLRQGLEALADAGLVHPKPGAVGEVHVFKHALVQEVAYQTLLRGRRRELHAEVAHVLEEQFPQQARDAPELVAHHWTEAGNARRAVVGWLAAGERASERSEYREAIGHLRNGTRLVPQLTDPTERRDQELALLLALGPVLIMAEGGGTPEVVALYARALDLCSEVPKSGLHFAAGWGRWRVAMDHRAGRERADELLQLAEELGDPALLLQAHHCQWATLYMLGEHHECCRHTEAGLALYDPKRHRSHPMLYGGHDAKVCALGERALSCWLLGRFNEALEHIRGALEWADALSHVGSRVHAMDYALQVHRLGGDAAEVARRGSELVAYADEQRLREHSAKGALFRGWAHALLGDAVGGLREMQEAMAWEEDAGTPEDFPLYYEMYAEACARAGQFEEGLAAVGKGFAQAERGRLVYWNPELHRRKGELLLAAGVDRAIAANCFESAIADARAQDARVLELRATASLARLLMGQGRSGEAATRLRAACRGFTQDPGARDLRDANALLEALA